MKSEYCRICFQNIENQLSFYDWLHQDNLICGNCKKQLHRLELDTSLHGFPLHIIYEYNTFFENLIFQYKEGRDIALAPIFFQDDIKRINRKYRHYHVVLMPSSELKTMYRGFFSLKEMLIGLHLPIIEPFQKTKEYKQSLQQFDRRGMIKSVMKLKTHMKLPSGPLLLIDDVCTSGSTIKWAYELLKEHTYKIEVLVLSAHPLFVEKCDKKGLHQYKSFSILDGVVRNGR